MTSFRRFTIAFWGGHVIGAVGLIVGMILMVQHQDFTYLIGSAICGLIVAFSYVQLMFKFVKVKS
ncbi:hypothetical protein FDG95_gp457 [Pectobacterium phage vB_PcaM_CBB]|uniref:Putative membrane protein n=1 Tax=Pectobacterium phage vB_PcaM_CBB TaxID=2772511 RepID=A0A1L2CVN4_9CAUD|nr:hypothetical protein FDG95_gp457 [Pectobacterium phage vB_PcaM_CBB]AMM44085.1 putative membrane protein [Pectobacterium phage vB_PcaM_CBB]